MDNKESTLLSKINNLNIEQLTRLLWVSAIRIAPFHTKAFLEVANKKGYLTLLFLSIDTCRCFSLCESSSIYSKASSLSLSLAKDMDLYIDKLLYDSFSVIPENLFDHNLALIICRTLYRARALKKQQRSVHDYNQAIEIIEMVMFNLDLDYEKYIKVKALLNDDIEIIREKELHKLNIDTKIYDETWKEWIDTLNQLGGEYWAKWYTQLFNDSFFITDMENITNHLSLPIELWNKEIDVSSQWIIELLRQGSNYLNEARVILLGEKGSGKTSLARRIIDPKAPMPTKEESTEGVDITSIRLSEIKRNIPMNRDANIHIWDFAGHAITHAAHRFFLSERCLYIIVYDGRTEGRNRLNYWLDHVRNYGGKSRVVILINLQDTHDPDIAENYFIERYAEHQCTFFKFSIENDEEKLNQFRKTIASIIELDPAWDQKIPLEYYDIKEKIQNIFGNNNNHISREEFDRIASNITVSERDLLLRSLDCLGVCLWYPDIKGIELLVLNPEWITRGIYLIINWIKQKGKVESSIKLDEFEHVFRGMEKDYPFDKHKFLYQLMQNYELAYKKKYCEEIVVPQCLPEDCPPKSKLPFFPDENKLYVEITACKNDDYKPRLTFPPDVLPRFIVRYNDELKKPLVWRYGAVLKKGDVTAMIIQEDYLIRLYVKGKERRDYYGNVLYTLMTVLNGYPSFVFEKPNINCYIVSDNGNSKEMIPLPQIVNLVQYMTNENKDTFFDYSRNTEISFENASMYIDSNIYSYTKVENNLSIIKTLERIENMVNKSSGNTIIMGDGNTVASDHSMLTYNNGIDLKEMVQIINKIKEIIPANIGENEREMISENADAIEEELKKINPRKGVINTLLNGIRAIKGSAEFAAAVAVLVQFVQALDV